MDQPTFIYASTRMRRRRRSWWRLWPRMANVVPALVVLPGAVLFAAALMRFSA